jgi:hypothetical protein
MNDLSVMFPLPTSQAELSAMLLPSANANGGQLFPEAVYQSSADTFVDYSSLVAVAFRLDPCFGQLGAITDPSACHAQLRVVFQPVAIESAPGSAGNAVAQDAAIHAFYSLTSDQLISAVGAIQDARHAVAGNADQGPLAPNPLIAAQGLTGTFAAQLEKVITTYAGAANLERFTSLTVELFSNDPPTTSSVGLGEFWSFDSFDVANGSATPRTIPALPQPDTSMGLSASPDPLEATLTPVTTSVDNLDVLMSFSQASSATPAALGSAFAAALRIENPHDNSPDTIDCLSCHMAQPAIQLVGMQLGMSPAGNPDAFVPDPSIPRADLAQTTMLVDSDQILNIHAFSYRNASPMINQRVINETAANLAYVAPLLP